MLNTVRQFLRKHRNKILAGIAFLAGGYFIYRFLEDQCEIKFSVFKEAVLEDKIDQIIFSDNSTIYFKNDNSDWFRTYFGNMNIADIYELVMYRICDVETKR